ncbi:MAG TPA: hypothetical protein VI365_06845 [Trebonia sp.]
MSGPGEVVLSFDQATVDLDALQRAAYAIADVASVDIRMASDEFACTLFPRQHDCDEDALRHRFRVEVNDQVLRVRIAKETEPLRNLVFALAFSATGLVDDDGDPDASTEAGKA